MSMLKKRKPEVLKIVDLSKNIIHKLSSKANLIISLLKKAMTRSQLEYILAVDRTRSFSKAAAACFVTQSTLSAMVGKFEKRHKITIFNRKSKPISLTQEGERLLKQLKNINREFEILDEVIHQIKGIETGNLSIAAIPTIAPYLFPKVLNDIAKKYPKVNFKIHEITTQQIIEDINSGKIDVGIVAVPLDIKGIVEIPLYTEPFLLYDKRDPEENSKNRVNVKNIDFSKLLLLEEGHCFRNQVEKICNLNQIKKVRNSITYYSGSIESLKKMVELNKGLTLLPFFSTLDLTQKNADCLRTFESPAPARRIGLIYHKNLVKTELLKGIEKIILKNITSQSEKDTPVRVVKPF